VRALFLLFLCGSLCLSRQNPSSESAVRQVYETGERALQQGDLVTAQKSFLQVLQSAPQDVGALVNLGVVFMREKNWPQALEYLKQAETAAPQVTGIRLNIGLAQYRRGDWAAAIPPFQSVLRDQPDSVQARRLLGLCYLFEERYPESAEVLEPLWPNANTDLSYLYTLAVAAGNAGRHALEERASQRLLTLGNDSPLVHLLLGKAYLAHEDYAKALEQLRSAAQADPKLPMVHYNLGVVYRHEGDLERARQEFLSDIAIEPTVAFNYDQLGTILYQLQHVEPAEANFRNAVERDPKLATSWFGLAKIYRQERRYQEALKALDAAGALDPQSASVHYLRAQIFKESGRKSDALAEMAAVQRLQLATRDRLEREVTGAKYRDPQLASEPLP
jgi:tetratricopeptide (TPR) repeat protein